MKEKICLDAGASTGGFTQVLLEEGAARVFAVDVGENLLDPSLREDPRVTALDKTNVRSLRAEDFPPLDFLTSDLSFISLRTVGQTLLSLLRPGGEAVLLIKPQFEAGEQFLNKNGIVKDPKVRIRIVEEISDFFPRLGRPRDPDGRSPPPQERDEPGISALFQERGVSDRVPWRRRETIRLKALKRGERRYAVTSFPIFLNFRHQP